MPAFERCVLLLRRYIFEVVEDTIEEVLADLGVGDLPPPEHDRDLHLVALAQQLLDGARLEVDVVHVDLRLHAHFTQAGLGLVLARLALLLRLLVLEAAEVHEAGDGGRGLAGDLDEVNVALAGHGNCVCGWEHTYLLTLFVNNPHFGNADALVNARLRRWWLRRNLRASFSQAAPRQTCRG